MTNQDIRWKQRFENFQKALSQLKLFIEKGKLNELEEQGLIQCFEYNYELAWNVLKDYLQYEGNNNITGSRTAIMEAFNVDLIADGEAWMNMFKDRNKTSHTYNQEVTDKIVNNIYQTYYQLFIDLETKFKSIL